MIIIDERLNRCVWALRCLFAICNPCSQVLAKAAEKYWWLGKHVDLKVYRCNMSNWKNNRQLSAANRMLMKYIHLNLKQSYIRTQLKLSKYYKSPNQIKWFHNIHELFVNQCINCSFLLSNTVNHLDAMHAK